MEASEIKAAVRKNHNVLVLGQAGTGKTSLLKDIYKEQKSLGRNVQISASTGIAATLLPGARTVHSFFGILDGRFTNEEMFQRLGEDSNLLTVKQRIIACDILIIDEISMLSMKNFLQIEAVCRHLRNKDGPFGGIQMILSGDLYQLRPVPSPGYGDMGHLFIEAEDFRRIIPHQYILKTVHRQSEGRPILPLPP